MWFILGVILSFSAQALAPFETLANVKILRILPNNIVLLNRGLEDGILRNDHAKLSSEVAGYSSRAIAIRVSGDVSYWKLYRIPHAEAFSLDYTYTITGMADREIPFPVAKLRDTIQTIPETEKKIKKDPGPDPFQIQQDLPERLTERDILQSVGPEQRKLFIEKTLNRDQLQRDLKDYRISLYASPFTRQSINDAKSMVYGIRGGNVAARYRLLTQFEQQKTELKDPLTKEKVSSHATYGQVQFIVNALTPDVSSLSLIDYRSINFSRLGTPDSHWMVGPIGFTWEFFESKTWEHMSLSYVPLYDLRTTEYLGPDGKVDREEEDGLRHGFRFAVKTRINERVAFENLLWVRPFQELATWEIDSKDLYLVNDLKLVFSLTENLFFDYNLIFIKDKLWKTLNNLPETNTINSLNIRFDFNL